MQPDELEVPDRRGIFGRTRCGKTRWAKRFVREQLLAGWPVVVLDVKDEWSTKGRPRDGVELGPLPYRWTAWQLLQRPSVLDSPHLRMAVVPDDADDAKSSARAFALVAKLLRERGKLGRGPLLLVLDEVQFWARHELDLLEAVATIWADYGVALVLISQRPAGLPIDARSQLSHLVSFSQEEPADIEALRDRTRLTDPTYHERVQRLSPGAFETWRAGEPATTNGAAHVEGKEAGNRSDADLEAGADHHGGRRRGDPGPAEAALEDGDGGGREGPGEGEGQLDLQGGRLPRRGLSSKKKTPPKKQRAAGLRSSPQKTRSKENHRA